MPDLLTTQRRFATALFDSQNASACLETLDGDATRNAQLLGIYRGNAIANASGALRLAYPVCEQVVGAECFNELARQYWRQHPPRDGDLNHYGMSLADFIATHEDLVELPWLADLARLEWALHQAGMASDHHALEFSALAHYSEENLAGARFEFQTAMHLLESDWPIASLWQQHQADYPGEFNLQGLGGETAMVFRQGFAAKVFSLPASEAAWLKQLHAGTPLMPALHATAEQYPDFTAGPALQNLFNHTLITAIHAGDAP